MTFVIHFSGNLQRVQRERKVAFRGDLGKTETAAHAAPLHGGRR